MAAGAETGYGVNLIEETHMLASQRDLFEIPRNVCYLNSASYSPLPLRTQEAGRAAVGRKGTPWTLDAAFANHQYERARLAAAALIHADPADIALIPSISYGVATAAKLVTIARGTRDAGSGKRPFLAGAGMADAGRGAGFCHRDDPPAARRRLDVCGSRGHRAARCAAGRPCFVLFGELDERRADRPRKGGRCAAPAGRDLSGRRDAERRRADDGRQPSRSGFRDLPDL